MHPDAFEVGGRRRIREHIRLEEEFAVLRPDPDAPLLDAPQQAHAKAHRIALQRIDAALVGDHPGVDLYDEPQVFARGGAQAAHRFEHGDRRALFQQ